MTKIDVTELTKGVMNEIEFDKLIAFKDDPIAFNAVKKFILYCVYVDGVAEKGKPFDASKNWALQMSMMAINPSGMPRSDAELGADFRALAKATNMVESGFTELSSLHKEVELKEEEANPAI